MRDYVFRDDWFTYLKGREMAKFTKAEMMVELKEIIYQYARGASFALDPEDGYRLLFGKNPANQGDLLHFMNPEIDSVTCDEQFSIERYQATRSIEQFYDYGLLGIRNISPKYVTDATEWTFAYGLIYDTAKSFLLSESLNGESVTNTKCIYAAKAFFARLILDGSERIYLPDIDGPDDMLTIAEVAILAELDERTVRNATSKNATNRLETSVVESNIYIPRESARAWLMNKRGFVQTSIGEELPSQAVLNDEFTNTNEAGEFIRINRERLNLDHAALASNAGASVTKKVVKELESGLIPNNEKSLSAIGNALGLNGTLFALRLIEVVKKQEIQELHRRIYAAL